MAQIVSEKERRRVRRRERNQASESRHAQPVYSLSADSSSSLLLRHVQPYLFEYNSQAKGRWLGQPVLAMLQAEYGSFPADYWPYALASGRLLVNGQIAEPNHVLKNGDKLSHWVHRHEPPVLGESITILAETPNVLVVSKPATVPIHPCGAFRYNSLPFLLERQLSSELGIKDSGLQKGPAASSPNFLVVHRLDRLTSGVVILAKSPEAARELRVDFDSGFTRKVYLARVAGDFGSKLDERWRRDTLDTEESIGWAYEGLPCDENNSRRGDDAHPEFSWITVQQPIRCTSHRDGAHECACSNPSVASLPPADDYKAARTMFRKLEFNGTSSLVECHPKHGRTHQIRLHLQFLGYPIANDPDYGPSAPGFKFRCDNLSLSQDNDIRHSTGDDDEVQCAPSIASYALPRGPNECLEAFVARTCVWCSREGLNTLVDLRDRYEPNDRKVLLRSCIWLHAWRYSCLVSSEGSTKWEYEAPPPDWAQLGK